MKGSSRMSEDIGCSLVDIHAKYAESKITTQLINIAKSMVPQQKPLKFLQNLKCLYFDSSSQRGADDETGNSAKPILKFKTINAFKQRRYVALSYTWIPCYPERLVPNGGYLVKDICSGSLSPSPVRDTVFSRMQRYMNYVGAENFWIDQHCIQQEDKEAQGIGVQAMDRVYSLSYYPVTLLLRTIKTSEQLELLSEVLSGKFVVYWEDRYWISASKSLETARRALDLLNYITSDTWFSRGWTYQENYRAHLRMTLLITHSAFVRAQKPSSHLGSLDGELCINSSKFYEQVTMLCLAYENHQPRPYYWERLISRAGKYTVLLQSDKRDGDSAEDHDGAPVSMSPTIIKDISNRELFNEWDRLAIIANCCQYVNHLDSAKLEDKHSLSLSLLALCLVNGGILSNHPKNNKDSIWTRRIPMADFLQVNFFDGLRSPSKTRRLTFNKGCRFSNVSLKEEGVETEGYLWRLEDEISTNSFHRYRNRTRRYRQRPPPLEWLARRLAARYKSLSQGIYYILNLEKPLTLAQKWQLSMASKVEEAIHQKKKLCTATATFPGPGTSAVAIFIVEPGNYDEDSDETEVSGEMSIEQDQNSTDINSGAQTSYAERLSFDEDSYVFTSIHRNRQGQQCFELNDINKHVSLEVDCCFGKNYWQFPRLYTRRWVHGLCFFQGCSPHPVIFPWPVSLQGL